MNADHIDWTTAVAIVGMAAVMVVWCSVCNWRRNAN